MFLPVTVCEAFKALQDYSVLTVTIKLKKCYLQMKFCLLHSKNDKKDWLCAEVHKIIN